MHEWTEQAQREAQEKIFRMAANDRDFRALALKDGRAAVEKATGKKLPQGFKIRFVDPAGAHLTAVLPRAAYEEEELAEFELLAVAGGKGGERRRGGRSGGSSDEQVPGAPE
jgi:hypothetical protein